MRDVDAGDAELALDLADLPPHVDAEFGVEVRQGFVEQQHRRLHDQRTGQGDPLLLPAGQLVGRTVFQVGQADEGEDVHHFGSDIVRFHFFDFQTVGDVFEHVEMGEQRITLKHHGGVATIRRQCVDPLAADQHVAAGRVFKAGDHAQDCGFAAAGRPEQGDEFARFDGEGNVVDGGDFPAAGALEGFDEVFDTDILGC